MSVQMNGLGSSRCIEQLPSGRQCQNLEVEGMEYCLKDMPERMLAEAEEVTGVRRCRQCREYADEGTNPPACKSHKVTPGKVLQMVRGHAAEIAQEIISERGSELENAPPVNDPYGELMAVTGELKAWKDIVRRKVGNLKKFGYAGKTGEQTTAEVMLYTQALRDLSSVLLSIGRLNLDARLVGIRQQTVEMMDRALDLALEEAGVGFDKKTEARQAFRRHLKVVA